MCTFTVGQTAPPETVSGRTYYVINLYTWLTDLEQARELAAHVAENLAATPQIDHAATTVSAEDGPTLPPMRVFLDLIS